MHDYRCRIDKVIDGDTVDVWIDLGFDVHLRKRVRLYGIDTPETRTRDAREKRFGLMARDRVRALLPAGSTPTYVSLQADGKYGRALGDFIIRGNKRTVVETLIHESLGVPYHGESRDVLKAKHEANFASFERSE